MTWIHCARIMITWFTNGHVSISCDVPDFMAFLLLTVSAALLIGAVVGAELTLVGKILIKKRL